MVSFESLGIVSYSHSIVTMAQSRIISAIETENSEFYHNTLNSMPPLSGFLLEY